VGPDICNKWRNPLKNLFFLFDKFKYDFALFPIIKSRSEPLKKPFQRFPKRDAKKASFRAKRGDVIM